MSTRPRCLGKSLAEQVAVKISTFPPAPQEMNTLRTQCGQLYAYDWISVPLVYTQVRTRPARLPLWKTEARKTQEAACEGKEAHPGSRAWTWKALSRAKREESRLLPGPSRWKRCDDPHFKDHRDPKSRECPSQNKALSS